MTAPSKEARVKVYLVMYHDYSISKTEHMVVCSSLSAAKARADADLWMRTNAKRIPDCCASPDENGTLWVRDTTPYKILELDYIDA